MSITGPQINTIDLGIGGTAASPTKTYTGILLIRFEPTFKPLADPRTFADGGVDRLPSPTQLTWDVLFDLTQYPDTTTAAVTMDQVLAFFTAGTPVFIRGNSAQWVQRHGDTTTWIEAIVLGELPANRDANLYQLGFKIQESAAISITPP